MKFRISPIIFCLCFCILIIGFWTPPAWALIPIQLQDLSYKDCPPELAEGYISSGSSQDANCFIITGKANNTSGKVVVDADIFGRIYDATNNPVMQNRGRLGSIDTVPPGISDFEFRISIPSNLETPLQLKQFKASGFKNRIGR
ncbi:MULTISPECIES: hypothetical protein [Planktothrix]|jgi:hypothetical protein|uniref:Biotin carboxylase n=4 Tax=Planktothrix TaxID=54304 RepID=A0A073CGG8_PLAA1|nr:MULTISPECIES: hypothetical protein [Planktothrix]MCF3607145.1 hypothetical protein [Planktothrix agardhii 1033]CAD5969431.1 hypothetical protein NO108_04052 [Planktothrix rubescens]BBD52986.1 hypothetical protein NIES204_02440 [Planktothrix agardhii NIES-204]KEI67002.1 hypothetical protein A19Y_2032 [Planktothrix agardhii NIVA-CYA 126/8]MBG0748476.1 hypothetical protein [Planktothrix agardhii KL2]